MILDGARAPGNSPQASPGEVADTGAAALPVAAAAAPRSATRNASAPETPESMLRRAVTAIIEGKDPQTLIRVAISHRDHWARLEETRAAAPEQFDGRASIYTGETYAEARDRWDAYRLLLVDELRGTHGGC